MFYITLQDYGRNIVKGTPVSEVSMLPYFRSQKKVISYIIRVIIGSENGPTCFIMLSVRRRPVRQTAQMREDFSSEKNGTKGTLCQRN